MSKRNHEITLIVKILRKSGQALSFSQLKKLLDLEINDKTLLRRLNELAIQHVIEKKGKTRGVTYKIAETDTEIEKGDSELLPLSDKSKELLTKVSLPDSQRIPVGYNRDFLDSYTPNVSSYLSENEKKKLAELGKTARQNEPAGTYAKDILQRLLIDLSWNSSRLEGNSYSLLDTERLLSFGEALETKSQKDAQMILNHKEAIEFIVANSEEIGFNRYTILNIHGLLSNNLLPDPAASGRLRRFGVGIQRSMYTPLGIPQLIEEMFDQIMVKVNLIADPFEQAFFIMVQLPYLQPFEDVNKRVSRLAANISLNAKNFVPISFVDVPKSLYIKGLLAVYELNSIELLKDVFLWAYERSSAKYSALRQSLGEPDPFRLKYRDGIRLLVHQIVANESSFEETSQAIKEKLEEVPESDQSKFRETVETELMSLHEGNIARFNIRLSQFNLWENKRHR
ncbi:MAG: Fic family protein [Ferruginibacter sp.]